MSKKVLALFGLTFIVFSIVYFLSLLGKNTIPFKVISILGKDHPERIAYEKFERDFPLDNDIYFSFSAKDLNLVKQISKRVYADLLNTKGVNQIVTPENFEVLRFKNNRFVAEPVKSTKFIERSSDLYRWSLFSKQEDYTLIKISFHENIPPLLEKKSVAKVIEYFNLLENEYKIPFYGIGTKVAIHYLTQDVFKTQKYITPLLILIISAGVFWLFRKISIVFIFNYLLFFIYGLTVICVLLVEGGHTPFSSLVLLFSLVVSTSDLVHYFCAYEKFNGDHNKIRKDIFVPCLLTTITTGGAFMALGTSEFVPVTNFGVLCCVASIIAFLSVFYFLPYILTIFLPKDKHLCIEKEESRKEKHYHFIQKYSTYWVWGSFLGLILMVISYPKLEMDDNFYEKFVPEHKMSISINHFRDNYSYIGSLDITLKDSGQNFKEIEKRLLSIEGVVNVRSLFTIKSYLEDIIPNDPNSKILKSILDMGISRNIFRDFYNKESDQHRILLFVDSYSGVAIRRIMKNASQVLNEKNVEHSPVGFISIREFLYKKILDEFIISFSITLLIIFVCFAVLFRSFLWALIAMIPNLVPIFFIPFAMSLAGIKIENNIAILVCITIGIAVDDTIHFLYQLKQSLKSDKDLMRAIINGSKSSSKALIGTTFLMSLSFCCFFLGDLYLTRQIGVFVILSFVLALIADLILIPAVLFYLEKSTYIRNYLIRL